MIRFRTATLADVKQMLDWAAAEGWNPGQEDAESFYKADPQGFFVAVDQSDTPVASISVVNHAAQFAFLGLYIVQPAHRGQGIGLGLWQHALRHAGARTVGLDGVAEQQENYQSSGFVHAGATTRFTGPVRAQTDTGVRLAQAGDIPALIAQEAAASGVAKPDYLGAWFSQTKTRATLLIQSQTAIEGFCTVRACQTGAKVGPLVAQDAKIAQRLITHAATLFGETLTLDVPQTAGALATLCTTLGLQPGFQTARMYRGPFSPTACDVFAVTSLELG